MKAPEKIYFSGQQQWSNPFIGLTQKVSDTDIEYIRTDAFIEKAFDAYCKVCGHFAHSVPTHICRHDCRYFSDFKTYLKGE